MGWMEREWRDRGLDLEPALADVSEAEFEALQEDALLVPLVDSGRLRLTGADRVDFLHGQVSNEVRRLKTGESNRSLLLNHRGHALADMLVLRRDEEIELVVDGGGLEVVEESLRRHIIFDQVELKRPEGGAVLTLQGPNSVVRLSAALEIEPPRAGEFVTTQVQGSAVTVIASRRSLAGGFDLVVVSDAVQTLVEALFDAEAVAGGRPALELARVTAGLPSAAGEAGEGVLPQESGLEPLVSYRKGCYLGQEIMARIEARGKMRRELAGLRLAEVPPGGERDIDREGRKVGRLGTVARHPLLGLLALAVLRSDVAEGATVEVGGVSGGRVPLPMEETTVAG